MTWLIPSTSSCWDCIWLLLLLSFEKRLSRRLPLGIRERSKHQYWQQENFMLPLFGPLCALYRLLTKDKTHILACKAHQIYSLVGCRHETGTKWECFTKSQTIDLSVRKGHQCQFCHKTSTLVVRPRCLCNVAVSSYLDQKSRSYAIK